MKDRIRTVLRVRELAERRAAARVAVVEQELRTAEDRVEQRKRDYYARQPISAPVGVAALRALQLQGLAAHELVTDALGERDLTIDRREELVRAWSATSIQRKSVERLAEIRAVERAAVARAAAERSLDESILLRRTS